MSEDGRGQMKKKVMEKREIVAGRPRWNGGVGMPIQPFLCSFFVGLMACGPRYLIWVRFSSVGSELE